MLTVCGCGLVPGINAPFLNLISLFNTKWIRYNRLLQIGGDWLIKVRKVKIKTH